jgi:hypothetical protein
MVELVTENQITGAILGNALWRSLPGVDRPRLYSIKDHRINWVERQREDIKNNPRT